ncbi:MAG: tRNA uridine-5-carboxymethylaminomethyl(34) synthesis enzyme MnmG [Rhodobacteraceae bacterium]|nr:tRNA uridine-5-carboxymethylaminomethyl(34) synthesis enzyme MnmG [Paracoccaceae bacterium]
MKHEAFDVIVIGGGHAGCEAAHAAARMGTQVALITLDATKIGVMSCNPAIGGLGKGHLVREIDALDGLMGRAADRAGIQFRLLNRRKGPAVQGPRTQADRTLYRLAVQEILAERPDITVVAGEVADLLMEGDRVRGVVLADGSEIAAASVIVTTGTFLRGVIHIGDVSYPAGRMGEQPSNRLADRFSALNLPLGRLKTGTPPRLDGRTINWEGLKSQPGDPDPVFLSFLTAEVTAPQVSCGITHTNERTHEIITRNLGRSAMYGGRIEGVGPRYCPSIEDKVVRFADKTSHQVFLEPEGVDDPTVYPNGISTSLPADVQAEYVHSMRGLERSVILQPGYAIEYDYVDPRALSLDLGVKAIRGLFLAGQINGTTGYEEAAAQGLVAGLNAAQFVRGREAVHFSRTDSYIGVMIDDLTSRGAAEPYRMFTSRAEFRLALRADNADQRLTPLGRAIGCVGESRARQFETKLAALDAGRAHLAGESWTPRELAAAGFKISQDGGRRSSLDVLAFPDVRFADLVRLNPQHGETAGEIGEQLWRDALYAKYLDRQTRDVETLRREESTRIPADFLYEGVSGLSAELQQKLSRVRPATMAQAARIEGMTPAALLLLLSRLRAPRKLRDAG